MSQRDNILQELRELKSQLADLSVRNSYSVPAGYFDNLAGQVLSRIRCLNEADANREIKDFSSLLSGLSRQSVYTVPAGYFDGLAERILNLVREQHPAGEIEALSPLLSGLKKHSPYAVPDGYFENITQPVNKPATLVVMRRTWVRYAAAAVITGVIALASFLYFNREQEPGGKAMAKFTKDVKKMDETQKDDLIDFIDAGLTGDETVKVNADKTKQIENLLQGVSDDELTDLQQQTEDLEEVLINE